MGLYIEREGSPITLEEWLEYIGKDNELTLSEVGFAINPLTKTKMSFQIAGRAIWNDFYEFIFDNGRIGYRQSDAKAVRDCLRALGIRF